MFNLESEKKSMRRPSCFITCPTGSSRLKPKKTIFTTISKEDFSDFHIQRHRQLNAGDSSENVTKQKSNWMDGNENTLLEVKMSKTFVVDRKKCAGHFSKLKKKDYEGYNKFLEQKSKNLEMVQLKTTIEKIQMKIEELSKTIEAKSSQKVQPERSSKIDAKVITAEDPVVIDEDCKFKWKFHETLNALAVVCVIIAFVFFVLYIVEGEFFFNSVLVPGSFRLRSLKLQGKPKHLKHGWFK